MSQKAGARHNKRDQAIIDGWHQRADELKADMAELGARLEEAVDQAADAAAKADVPATPEPERVWGAVKAAGDWELDVLGVPYGGPNGGKDAHGEFFSERTHLHEDKFGLPPAVYYHGYGDDGRPMGEPAFIGRTVKRWRDAAGVWFRVVLDKGSQLARRVWDAAQAGKARASSGTVAHLRRVEAGGHIAHWPVAELSVFDTDHGKQPANAYAVAIPALKSVYQQAGLVLPDDLSDSKAKPETDTAGAERPVAVAPSPAVAHPTTNASGDFEMTPEEIQKLVADGIKAARDAEAASAAAEKARQEEIAAAVKAERERLEAEAAKSRRLPLGAAPYQARFGETWKYDNLDAADTALLVQVLGGKLNGVERQAPEAALKALALKLAEDKSRVGEVGQQAMKAAGIKANEVMQQDLTGFGVEWVGVAYGQSVWDAVRAGTFVAANLPSIEVPAGHESIYLPLEGADPTFYKVAETTDIDATTRRPNASVTYSQMATSRKQLTLAKMGARVLWSGELEEDSLIPFVRQLRMQLEKAGAEQLEHAIIDGDTDTSATTNINHIGGTPTSTDLYLLFNGFRKSPLVTTTANSRSASGSFVVTDFINTAKLLGTAGLVGADQQRVAFIVDPNTYWRSLELPEVRTRDVFTQPTIESGNLSGIYGYRLYRSYFMHYKSADRKANTAGKVDQTTTANNITGAILAVRWDQWKLGYRRRMTVETQRFPDADATQIVGLMRLGLVQRDTEAAAITYNVGLS